MKELETAFESYQRRLQEALRVAVVEVRFSKVKTGEIRVMKCTLLPEYLPVIDEKTESHRVSTPTVTCVWDLEKKDWRSFRNDMVRSWSEVMTVSS